MNALNISFRRHGGLRFLKVGRFFIAFAVCKEYRAIGEKPRSWPVGPCCMDDIH